MVASSTSPSYCPHLTDMLCFVLEENHTGSICTWVVLEAHNVDLMSLHLHFSLRSVLRARDVKLGKGNAVAVHFINDEHLVAEIKEDLSAYVLLLVSGGIRTFRIHVSVFSVSHL